MEQLAGMEPKELLLMLGAMVGTLAIMHVGSLGTGLVFLLRLAHKHGKAEGVTQEFRKKTKSDLDEAHRKIRELADGE